MLEYLNLYFYSCFPSSTLIFITLIILYFIINNYTEESGVRDLERVLSSLARKITINNVKVLNEERVVRLLGNPKYTSNLVMEEENGVVNTLAVSNSGGTLSKVEVVTCKGNDKLTITGNAGNILKESISVVLTMLKLKYKYSFHNEDIHVHFLDASSKKDGPSAGIALSVALCSLKENKKVKKEVFFEVIFMTYSYVNNVIKWKYFKNWWTQRKTDCCI